MTENGDSFTECVDNYNVIAVIPCFGRFPLLRQTVSRIINKNRVKVLLVGHEKQVEQIAKEYKCHYLFHDNTKLGQKWNAGFQYAKHLNPDAVLFVGSSDWVSDNWVSETMPLLKDYEMVGTLGCYLLDLSTVKPMRLVYWAGYGEGERATEPIGIGRLISKRALNKMNWSPFDPLKDNSMDWQMWRKVLDNGGTVKIVDQESIKSVSISTNLWPQKHQFEQHWKSVLKSDKQEPAPFVSKYFPEANKALR